MKVQLKPIGALISAGILLSTLICPAGHAQTVVVASGDGVLMNSAQVSSSSEELQVYYSVVLTEQTGMYEYSYQLLNPAGDVELPGAPNPGAPVSISSFQVSFDTTAPGAYLFGTAPVGGTLQNNGLGGLAWTFSPVAPGGYSPSLVFDSSLPPVPGNASVSGSAIPPSPWTGIQQVSVPRQAPEPETTALLVLGGTFFAPRIRRFFRRN